MNRSRIAVVLLCAVSVGTRIEQVLADTTVTTSVTYDGTTYSQPPGQLIIDASGNPVFTLQNSANTSGIQGLLLGAYSSGTLSVDSHSTLSDSSGISVGAYGTGTLAVQNGATLTTDGVGYLGQNGASSGSVTVSGTGSTWNGSGDLYVGYAGGGTLMVQAGGAISSAAGIIAAYTTGTATLTNAGSSWTCSSNLSVGAYGAGTLTVQNGATLTTDGVGYLGQNGASSGSVTVSGTGWAWNGSGDLYVGYAGGGTLMVQAGATLNCAASYIAARTTGTATLTDAGSSWTCSGGLSVGGYGTGSLTVQNGAALTTHGTSYLGVTGSGVGSVTVSGTGSTWTCSSALNVGYDGNGTVTVQSGAALTTQGDAALGVDSGSAGTVTVTGAGSTWTANANAYIGGSSANAGGMGGLTVTDSGKVNVSGSIEIWGQGKMTLNGATFMANSINVDGGTICITNSTVTSPVSISTGVLELAGSIAALSQAVNIANNSTAATTGGLYVSGVNQRAGTITGAGNTVIGSATTFGSLTAYQVVQNSLVIHGTSNAQGSVTLLPSGSGTTANSTGPNNVNFSSTLNMLSIDSDDSALGIRRYYGTLDIGNSGLVIQYGSGTDPFATITDMIRSGYAGGTWNGTGINSSLARAAVVNHSTPLNIGLFDFIPNSPGFGPSISFEGQTITTSAVLVRLTYMDDLVLAGDMQQANATSDALFFAANFGSGTVWGYGDITHDGVIDTNDALLFAANYVVGLPSLDGATGNAGAVGGNAAAVPEPSTIVLAALGLAVLAMRRRGLKRGEYATQM